MSVLEIILSVLCAWLLVANWRVSRNLGTLVRAVGFLSLYIRERYNEEELEQITKELQKPRKDGGGKAQG